MIGGGHGSGMGLAPFLSDIEMRPDHERAAAVAELRAWISHQDAQNRRDGCSLRLLRCGTVLMIVISLLICCMVPNRGADEAWGTSVPVSPLLRAAAGSGRGATMPRRRLSESIGTHGNYPNHSAFERPIDALRRLRPDRRTSDFPLILCAGHGKSATKSLSRALIMLGFSSAHFFGAGIYGLLHGNAAEIHGHDFFFKPVNAKDKHVDAVLDTPVVDFYNEILLTYPNARVILSVRNVRSWLRSQQSFYKNFGNGCANWQAPWRRGSNLVFGTECPSPEQAVKRYTQHNRNVFDAVPRQRLLVMDIPGGDGWDKLCPFLGVQPPNGTFPSRH